MFEPPPHTRRKLPDGSVEVTYLEPQLARITGGPGDLKVPAGTRVLTPLPVQPLEEA